MNLRERQYAWDECNKAASEIVAQDAKRLEIDGKQFYAVIYNDELFADFELIDLAHSLAWLLMAEKEALFAEQFEPEAWQV